MDSPEDGNEDALTPEQRAAMRQYIGEMGLTDYLRKMCSIELTPAHEAMILSWWKVQMQAVQHNLEVAYANGYTRGRGAGRRCPISLN